MPAVKLPSVAIESWAPPRPHSTPQIRIETNLTRTPLIPAASAAGRSWPTARRWTPNGVRYKTNQNSATDRNARYTIGVWPNTFGSSMVAVGGVGLGVSMVGGLILAYLAALKVSGEDIGGRPLLWLGFFCVLGGLQFLTTGVIAELLIRIYYNRGEIAPYHTSHTAPQDADQAWHRQD